MTVAERRAAADICPVGLGLIDFKTLFANAGVGGIETLLLRAGQCSGLGRFARGSSRELYESHEDAIVTSRK